MLTLSKYYEALSESSWIREAHPNPVILSSSHVKQDSGQAACMLFEPQRAQNKKVVDCVLFEFRWHTI